MSKIKQILFDCGGVFVDIQFRQLIEKLSGSKEAGEAFYDRLFSPGTPWGQRYDKGLCTKQEAYEDLLEWMGDMNAEVLRKFMDEWPYWLPTFPEMETIVDELHAKGFKCYLLSNFSEQYEEFEPLCPALAHLDGKLISYRIHMIKPNHDIFEYAAKEYGIKPEETIFVDDNLPNVKASCEVGYQGYHFTSAAEFRSYLKEQGIL